MGKNVAVFVDVANIFYAAKSAGVDIDYVTLLKSASAGRDLVRAYAYTGLDPDNENQRNFHSFLARNGYRVVSKDIRKYGDGKVKANLDIELVVDMMKTARNLDIAIVVSGDGDFAPAIRAVQEQGVRVEVISFRGNTSSDLIDVADQFTDIIQLAKVEKGSSRSGRRVADDEQDLSMTEVPDKQTEGTGAGRGRGGRGRFGRGRIGEAEPVAARRAPAPVTPVAPAAAAVAVTSSGAPLVVLPGEKLSRVTPVAPADIPRDVDGLDADQADEVAEGAGMVGPEDGALDGDPEARRRRRRRGGRGRGRGRGEGEQREVRGEVEPRTVGDAPVRQELSPAAEALAEDEEDADEFDAPQLPAARTNTFGSVWDSQLGVANRLPTGTQPVQPVGDDDDFEEPEIPEYLIAERRNRGRGPGAPGGQGNRGGRGARGGYAAAIERERYGRGGSGGGINRYPDVSGRERSPERGREDRGPRPAARPAGGGVPARPAPRPAAGSDPWSEVPPELEAMLRAQLGGRSAGGRRPEGRGRDVAGGAAEATEAPAAPASDELDASASTTNGTDPVGALDAFEARDAADALQVMTAAGTPVATPEPESAAPPRRRGRRPAVEAAEVAVPGHDPTSEAAPNAEADAETTPKRRTTRRRTTADATPAPTADAAPAATEGADAAASDGADTAPEEAAPRRRTTRRRIADSAAETPAADAGASATDVAANEAAAPRRRTTRRKAADTGDANSSTPDAGEGEPAAAPRRRTRRTTSSEDAPAG